MSKSHRHEIGVGLLLVAALALLAWMSLKVGAFNSLGETILVHVDLEDAAGLSEGAEVKIAGVPVGRVESLVVDHDKATLQLRLESTAEIRVDAIVQVRARSLLGEKYVSLRPQSDTADLLEDGDSLEVIEGLTEIDQLVNRLGPLLETLDPTAIGETMNLLQGALESDPGRLERMLEDSETILDNTATASERLPTISEQTELLIADLRVVSGDAQLTLAEVREATAAVQPLLDRADGILDNLESAIEPIPEVSEDAQMLIQELREAVAEGRTLLTTLDSSSETLVKVLDNLSEIDKTELRRLLREEGILVRLRESEVVLEPRP